MMDKNFQSSSAPPPDPNNIITNTTSSSDGTSSRDHYLRHLNKLSQKISKQPMIKKPTTYETPIPPPTLPIQNQNQNPFGNNNNSTNQQSLQHQPPVYNINKNDFREVVQKLTGSPAHERIITPPPIQQPKPQSSRLQRIRPPPLPSITNHRPPPPQLFNQPPPPPPQLQLQPPPPQPSNFNFNGVNFNPNSFSAAGFGVPRNQTPLSPLPPLPTVHAAAESPISAYMRDLHSIVYAIDNETKNFSGFSPLPLSISPQLQNQPPPEQPQQQQEQEEEVQQEEQPPPAPAPAGVQSQAMFQMPTSPNPFGCLNSQLSSYPLLSPGLLFSPNSGQLGFPQLPLSPTVPALSPRWRDL